MTARVAVLLVQLWLGYPYMFLVATGALQAIPRDLTEAAAVDGAKPFQAFRAVIFPLLLVALAPLLIASFAFNFNNFNAIYLTTEGGPFPPDNPQLGATDLLITYTYRLAFGAQGAQYGFAAAVSIFIFLIVAMISIVGFRRTRHSRRSTDDELSRPRRRRSHPHPYRHHHRRARRSSGSAAPRVGGGARSAGATWSRSVALIFALFPILFVLSAALNPLGTLSSTAADPDRGQPGELQNLFERHRVRHWFINSMLIAGWSRRSLSLFLSALRGLRVLPLPLQRPPGRAAVPAADPDVPAVPGHRDILPDVHHDHRLYPAIGFNTPWGLILLYLGGALGVNTWLMKGFFDTVPKELDESATGGRRHRTPRSSSGSSCRWSRRSWRSPGCWRSSARSTSS